MIKRLDKILPVVFLAGFFLSGAVLAAGMTRADASGSGKKFSSESFAGSKRSLIKECTQVTQSDILLEINTLPEPLKKQFRDGNITFDLSGQKLVFKGYVTGNGNNIRTLLSRFEKWRGEKCVRVVSFEGKTDSAYFEWRSEESLPVPDKCEVGSVIESVAGNQFNKTLFYDYDSKTGVLELTGHLGDAPGRGRFNSLIARLQRFMQNGCISKIVFKPKPVANDSGKLFESSKGIGFAKIGYAYADNESYRRFNTRGFEWQICEYPSCECSGTCKSCSDPC